MINHPKPIKIFITCALLSLASVINLLSAVPVAEKGFIDLTNYDFEKSGILKLRGEWEFYWNDFIEPGSDPLTGFCFILQPRSWTDFKNDNIHTEVFGYASYRLRIKLPDNIINDKFALPLALKVVECHSAYHIYINGRFFGGNGTISKTSENFKPHVKPKIFTFLPESSVIEIVIHASNFFDSNQGGMDDHVLLGYRDQIMSFSDKQSALFLLAFGILLIMVLYHLMLFLLMPRDRLNLYFAMICLLLAMLSIWAGDKLILHFVPGLGMSAYYKIWLMEMGVVGLLYLYAHELFPVEIDRSALRISGWFFIIHTLIVIFTPISTYLLFVNYFFFLTLLALLYLLYGFILAVIRKREFAWIVLIGMLIPIAFGINDMLFGMDLIVTGYFAPIGFLFFMISQSYLISLKVSRAFQQTELLSIKLEKLNIDLEKTVADRTEELIKTNEELKQLNITKDKFISIISHDLKNPFNSILLLTEMLTDHAINMETEKIAKVSGLLGESARKSLKLLENLVEWSGLQSGKISFNPVKLDLNKIIEENIQLLDSQNIAKNLKIVRKVSSPFYCIADFNMLSLIIRNLLTNAVKFSHTGGTITISANHKNDHFEVAVIDQGVGIPEEMISKLFLIESHFSKKGTRDEEGTGLGLILCKEFIKRHGGEIWVESKLNEGSRFIFTIPQTTF